MNRPLLSALLAAPLLAAPLVAAWPRDEFVQEALGPRGMVVAGHPEAAEAGVAVLRAGGNAMDAAVAVALALGVSEPYGSGMGGKLVLLHYRAETGEVGVVEGLGQASRSVDVARVRALSAEEREQDGVAVCVPGLPAALAVAHGAWGSIPFADAVAPAIEVADRGLLVEPETVTMFQAQARKLARGGELGRIYGGNGGRPEVGSRIANPELAATMRAFATGGADEFYRGETARRIVAAVRAAGGDLTEADLAEYEANLTTSVSAKFGPWRVHSAPPPTVGGAFVLAGLAIAPGELDRSKPFHDPANLDAWGRVIQQVYRPLWAGIGDAPGGREALATVLSNPMRTTLRDQARRAHPARPFDPAPRTPAAAGARPEDGEREESTTHFVVVDAAGNIVTATQSLSHHFGGGLVAAGTGIILNNDLTNAAFNSPGSVNQLRPGYRPRSTITPTIVLRDERPVLAIGLPGGGRIPTAMLQALTGYIVFRADAADLLAWPRVHVDRPMTSRDAPNRFRVEAHFPEDAERGLRERGWQVDRPRNAELFGGYCAIEILPDGTRRGLADLRRTNAARAE